MIEIRDTGYTDISVAVEGRPEPLRGRVDLIYFYNALYEAGNGPKGERLLPSEADTKRAAWLAANNFPGVSKTAAHLLLIKLSEEVDALKKNAPSGVTVAPPASTETPSGNSPEDDSHLA